MLGVLVVALVTASEPALGSPCSHVTVTGRLDPVTHYIDGTATCLLARDANLRVAAYPRLLKTPIGIDDVRQTWFYPDGFDPADMTIAEAPFDDGIWSDLGAHRAGQTITVHFATHVPRRTGVFGERDGTFYMLGGWHPAFADINAPVMATQYDYDITSPRGTVGFVGTEPFGIRSRRRSSGQITGRFVPWLVAQAANVTRDPESVIIAPTRNPHGATPYDLKEITSGLDTLAMQDLRETVGIGAGWADVQHIDRQRLIVVIAPLREKLVERFDGGIAVSDRAFHIIDSQKKLHALSIWRAQLGVYADATTRDRESGRESLPPLMISDMVAVLLRDALARGLFGEIELGPALLEHVAIIPEIDQLIFAPQTTFADAYYEAIDETPKVRLHLDDFDTMLPRGKLIAMKLTDRMGDAGALAIAQTYVARDRPMLAIVRSTGGDATVAGLEEWIGPTPKVDYYIGEIRSDEYGAHVRVDVRGPDADKVHEPITVRARESRKKSYEAKRIGPGWLEFPLLLKTPSLIEIDPYQRTVQAASQPGETTRFNDRDHAKWRFLLSDIGGLIAVTNKQLNADVEFALRKLNDLRFAYTFGADYSPQSVGVGASAIYKFGSLVTPLLYSDAIALSLGYDRLRANFDNATPGDLVSIGLSYGHDDRLSPYYGFRGNGISLATAFSYGRDIRGVDYTFGSFGAGFLKIYQVAFGHALVGRIRGDILVGTVPKQAELRLGGRYFGGRGYEQNEASATRRAIASFEYRHMIEGDMRSDFARLLMFTRIEGALFADAIAMPVHRTGLQSRRVHRRRLWRTLRRRYLECATVDAQYRLRLSPQPLPRPTLSRTIHRIRVVVAVVRRLVVRVLRDPARTQEVFVPEARVQALVSMAHAPV